MEVSRNIRNDHKRQPIKWLDTNILPTLVEIFTDVRVVKKRQFLILSEQITDDYKEKLCLNIVGRLSENSPNEMAE